MFNQQAFELLQHTLCDARNLFLNYFPNWDEDISAVDMGLRGQFLDSRSHYDVLRGILRELAPAVVLILRDHLMMNYVLFCGDGERDFFSVGPFRSLPLEEKDIIDLRRKNRLSTDGGETLRSMLLRVPSNIMRVEGISVARNLLLSFYQIAQPEVIERGMDTPSTPITLPQDNFHHRAKQMEEVYAHENRLAASIAQGNYGNAMKEAQFFLYSVGDNDAKTSQVSHRSYLYAANTVLRLSAGSIGIHPVFLDSISRRFAQKLSLCATHSQLDNTYFEMIEEYCHLCAEYPGKQYGQEIQRVMNYVRFNLSDNLTPGSIAQAVNFSPSYVSRRFKEEVGVSLMAYISEQRIQMAKRLLSTTEMSVREVASYVGIPDWNYFTKLFKKSVGCTPSEYHKGV